MSVFGQAGLLMAYGIGVVFLALIIFLGTIVLLTKIFPRKGEDE